MNLVTLIENLENNLTREIVGTTDGDTVSYTALTSKTVTINNTAYLNVNRVCLIADDTTTNLYLTSYDYKKITKLNIADITSITIT